MTPFFGDRKSGWNNRGGGGAENGVDRNIIFFSNLIAMLLRADSHDSMNLFLYDVYFSPW